MRVAVLCGSFRKGSYNQALLDAAIAAAPGHGLEIVQGDISTFPLFSADYEAAGWPPQVEEVRALVRSSDCLLLVTPEYNHGVPGPLKNAFDFLSRPVRDPTLFRRPMALMGASTGYMGTMRAQMAWRQICTFLKAPVFMEAEVTIAFAPKAFDEQGVLVDEKYRGVLDDYLEKLRVWLEDRCAVPLTGGGR
jgi:chromate reductase